VITESNLLNLSIYCPKNIPNEFILFSAVIANVSGCAFFFYNYFGNFPYISFAILVTNYYGD